MLAAILAAQEQQPEIEPPKPAEKPVYAYQGKALKIAAECADEEIQAFGLTCSADDPCPLYLELAAVDGVGNRLFATGNIHATDATLWSILLASEDGGKTWTEGFERMKSTGLEHMQFADFENGWIGGQQLLSLPRDPFFLITNDGGKTWRKRPLSGEPRVGAVEQFFFENRNIGSLVVDRVQAGDAGGRHEFYETRTSGDAWSLVQVSPKPIALKKQRAPNPDWRLRTDSKTKSFLIEQRSGARWNTAASFLINTGECKPKEVKLTEPVVTEDENKPVDTLIIRTTPPVKKKK
ncbi:MAG: hypothetical protein HYZ37_12985 [Candidatus Solibacter usitatus]|nr:hypothetical protein [Candidatus Solibacter usitatus]